MFCPTPRFNVPSRFRECDDSEAPSKTRLILCFKAWIRDLALEPVFLFSILNQQSPESLVGSANEYRGRSEVGVCDPTCHSVVVVVAAAVVVVAAAAGVAGVASVAGVLLLLHRPLLLCHLRCGCHRFSPYIDHCSDGVAGVASAAGVLLLLHRPLLLLPPCCSIDLCCFCHLRC